MADKMHDLIDALRAEIRAEEVAKLRETDQTAQLAALRDEIQALREQVRALPAAWPYVPPVYPYPSLPRPWWSPNIIIGPTLSSGTWTSTVTGLQDGTRVSTQYYVTRGDDPTCI